MYSLVNISVNMDRFYCKDAKNMNIRLHEYAINKIADIVSCDFAS